MASFRRIFAHFSLNTAVGFLEQKVVKGWKCEKCVKMLIFSVAQMKLLKARLLILLYFPD